MNIRNISLISILIAMGISLASCNKQESYSNLLRQEEKAVNWYLAQKRVETAVPADSVLEIGPDAPYYRMDADGNLYMQIVDAGDKSNMPKTGDKVFFRYMRSNIKYMYEGVDVPPAGNLDDLNDAGGDTSFFYGNTYYPTTVQFGTGIQEPLKFVGYYSEVNLVMKSYTGFTEDISQCIPYAINVKYYKSEY